MVRGPPALPSAPSSLPLQRSRPKLDPGSLYLDPILEPSSPKAALGPSFTSHPPHPPIPRIALNQNSTVELEFTLETLILTRNVTLEPNSTPITPKSDTMEPSPSPRPHFQVADPKLNSGTTTTQDPEPNIHFQNFPFRQSSGAFTAQGLHIPTSQAWGLHSSERLVQNEAQEPSCSAFLF